MGNIIHAENRFRPQVQIVPAVPESELIETLYILGISEVTFKGVFDDPVDAITDCDLSIGDSILARNYGPNPLYYLGDYTFCRGLKGD